MPSAEHILMSHKILEVAYINFDLTPDQTAVRAMAREFAADIVAPGAARRDETGEFPLSLVQQMGDLGFFGIPVAEEFGGTGGDTVSYALAVEEIARVDGSLALTFAAHVSIGIGPVVSFGTPEQKKRWLPKAISGEYLAAFGLTEPEAGSDAGGTQSKASWNGEAWVLNGQKIYITNAAHAGFIVCTAVTEDEGPKHRRISSFIVPAATPGFTTGPAYRKLGLRSSDTRPLYFDDCRLDAGHLLGRRGQGFRQFMATLDGGRISIGAMAVGLAQGAFELALSYAQGREQFGRPISRFQAVQFKLADMAMQIELARTAVLRAAWLKDQGRPYTMAAAQAKLFASEMATRTCDQALQIHGGLGYMQDCPVERYLRDVRLCEIGEGTSEIQRLVIARQLGC